MQLDLEINNYNISNIMSRNSQPMTSMGPITDKTWPEQKIGDKRKKLDKQIVQRLNYGGKGKQKRTIMMGLCFLPNG